MMCNLPHETAFAPIQDHPTPRSDVAQKFACLMSRTGTMVRFPAAAISIAIDLFLARLHFPFGATCPFGTSGFSTLDRLPNGGYGWSHVTGLPFSS